MNTQRIRLDLDKSLAAGQIVVLGQGDKEGTTIEAEVFDNGVSANLVGMTASFRMRLPDGTSYYDESAEVSGNVVSVTVDETYAASVHGYTDDAYFTLTDDERTYSTARFRIKVLRAADDDAVLPEPYINRVEEAIENANEAAEDAREAAGGVTPLMSELVRGGAKLGDGLALTGEALGVSPITTAQIDTIAGGGSVTSENVLTGTRLTYLWTKLKAGFASLVNGVVSVAQGGTGKGSHTSNSVLVGDGTNAVKNVASASGALYATASNGAPKFGTLPVAQGGTGATTAARARTNLDAAQSNGASGTLKAAEDGIDALEASFAYVESTTATENHAVGDYFMLGDVLMKATAAIAAGETINASKATPATVQGQIDTLQGSVNTVRGDSANGRFVPNIDGVSQAWGILANVRNASNKFYGKDVMLVVRNTGLAAYEYSTGSPVAMWDTSEVVSSISYTSVMETGVTGTIVGVIRWGHIVYVRFTLAVSTTSWVKAASGLPTRFITTPQLNPMMDVSGEDGSSAVKVSVAGSDLMVRATTSGTHNIDDGIMYICN